MPRSSNPADPQTRNWNATLSLRDGSEVMVSGACSLPGRIVVVFYPSTGQRFVAADAGDYVCPCDVRFDSRNDVLYVKAAGWAPFSLW